MSDQPTPSSPFILKNIGAADRGVRLAFGIVMVASLALFPILQSPWILVLAAVGTVPLLTGLSGFCPLYRLVRFDTGVPPEAAHA